MPNEVKPFAAAVVNEITPSNLRTLNYWLASTIAVVTAFIVGGYLGDERTQEKHDELVGVVNKLSIVVGEVSDSQIRTDEKVDSHRALVLQEQGNTDRRFTEMMSRFDDVISKL